MACILPLEQLRYQWGRIRKRGLIATESDVEKTVTPPDAERTCKERCCLEGFSQKEERPCRLETEQVQWGWDP
jgi:hypothetical protein